MQCWRFFCWTSILECRSRVCIVRIGISVIWCVEKEIDVRNLLGVTSYSKWVMLSEDVLNNSLGGWVKKSESWSSTFIMNNKFDFESSYYVLERSVVVCKFQSVSYARHKSKKKVEREMYWCVVWPSLLVPSWIWLTVIHCSPTATVASICQCCFI